MLEAKWEKVPMRVLLAGGGFARVKLNEAAASGELSTAVSPCFLSKLRCSRARASSIYIELSRKFIREAKVRVVLSLKFFTPRAMPLQLLLPLLIDESGTLFVRGI